MDKTNLENKVSEVANSLDLRDMDVAQILVRIAKHGGVSTKKLIMETGIPKTNLSRIFSSFKDLLEPSSPSVVVKEEERAELLSEASALLSKIKYEDYLRIEKVINNYSAFRPTPNRNFDQFTATEETSARRGFELANNGDLYKRSVAFLGDDDLTSIAAGMTKQAKRITVFEIDERITSLIEKISLEYNLDIEIVKKDLRSPFTKEYLSQFDTVFTDPPYTTGGISLFLNRGVELLKKRYMSRLYLCYGNSDRARERELEIQKIITDKELLIHSKLFQFNKYTGAESIGSSSSLFLLDWTPKTKSTDISGKLYTNE